MPHHEIRRVALAVIPKLFSELEPRAVWGGQQLDLVAGRLKRRSNQPLVLPGESPEQDRHAISLSRCERPFDRTMKMGALPAPLPVLEPAPLLFDPSLNLLLNFLSRLERK